MSERVKLSNRTGLVSTTSYELLALSAIEIDGQPWILMDKVRVSPQQVIAVNPSNEYVPDFSKDSQ